MEDMQHSRVAPLNTSPHSTIAIANATTMWCGLNLISALSNKSHKK